MRARHIVLSWLAAGFALIGCGGEGGVQKPGPGAEWTAQMDAAAIAADAGGTDKAMDPPDAAEVVEACRKVEAQQGPARAAIMGSSSAGSSTEKTLSSAELYGGFERLCAACHGNSAALSGNLLVTNLAAFEREMNEERLARLTTTDVAKVMPPGPDLLSQRPASDPVVLFAQRLEAWIGAGRPQSFPDPTQAPEEDEALATDGPPFALSKSLGESLTNMGSCVPAARIVNRESEPMDELDAMFAGLNDISELPRKLSQTDLVSLDSETLAHQGVISFAPAYTLWADDAAKMRYVRVPRGQSIRYAVATQSFEIPENTRFYKTFLKEVKDASGKVGYRKLETRIIVARREAPAQGDMPEIKALYGTYLWNEDESEAELLSDPLKNGKPFADKILAYVKDEAKEREIRARRIFFEQNLFDEGASRHYAVPGAERCRQCHLGGPDGMFVLGFTPLQINRRPIGEGGVIEHAEPDELNQLERFIEYGLITGITKEEVARKLLPLEKSQGARSPRNDYELIAQGYMLGNCAHCHNPNGFASRTAPVLKDVLNMMPSPSGGGIFEFPLDRVSPRIQRRFGSGLGASVDMPYITPSLYDHAESMQPYIAADYQEPPVYAPWRSLIYRNVDTAFTYSDNNTIYPRMPLSTAGYDCRVRRVMGEWMVSIPAINVSKPQPDPYPLEDTSPQPFVEVRRGDAGYKQALDQAQLRLSRFRRSSRFMECSNQADIVDFNAKSDDPAKTAKSVLNPLAFPPWSIPNRPHYVETDNTVRPGPWTPRNPQWEAVFADDDFSSYPENSEQEAAKKAEQQALVAMLESLRFDDGIKQLGLTPLPMGLWQEKPGCKFDGIPTVASVPPDPGMTWIEAKRTSQSTAPVYMQSPGEAIFGMICINCHGANLDATGRQSDTVASLSGGKVTVANFREGLFGPPAATDQNRSLVFGPFASGTETFSDLAARYLTWMALGGTRVNIPQSVLRVVGANPVFGVTVNRGVTTTPNMLEVAFRVCGSLLPMEGGSTKTLGSATTNRNGDAEMWRKVCTFRNDPMPIRAYLVDNWQASTLSYRTVQSLFKRRNAQGASAYPGDAAIFDKDFALRYGLSDDNLEPACVLRPDPVRPNDVAAAERWAQRVQIPFCPAGLVQLTLEEQQTWARRGAINAGFSVYAYLDAFTRNHQKPRPTFDQCEKLEQNAR